MTARLTRLRIAGFKSFAEPVSLDILPGLTGIVGPNGCGKSNVVEALRWAMGESSARSLRGAEMDDVIFAGTTARASRNLAEVTITLDAGGQSLPAPFEAEAELQVTRRIERGAGSAFRANGRELRARDVQTLYADLASGARSSGMVSQGRVADLVRSRPEERRQVLEEAAGITGLHARRHEAELKLRAAEQNLARAEDLRTQLDGARESLRQQARQAARYRAISGLIRAGEADHLAVLHGRATAELIGAGARRAEAAAAQDKTAEDHRDAVARLADAEAGLPAPRQAEADARSLLERRRLEAEGLADEALRVDRETRDAGRRLEELEADLGDADRARVDCDAAAQRVSAELLAVSARLEALPGEIEDARKTLTDARSYCLGLQSDADLAAERSTAAAMADRQAADARQAAAQRVHALQSRDAAVRAELARSCRDRVPVDRLDDQAEKIRGLATALASARAAIDHAEAERARQAVRGMEARASLAAAMDAQETAARLEQACAARAAQACSAHRVAQTNLAGVQADRIETDAIGLARDEALLAETALAEAETAIDIAERTASLAFADAADARRAAQDLASIRGDARDREAAARQRAQRIGEEAQSAAASLAAAEAALPSPAIQQATAAARVAAEERLAACQEAAGQAELCRVQAGQAVAAARRRMAVAEAASARLAAEAAGLCASLGDAGQADAALAALRVPQDLSAAVGVALGVALGADASLDPGASCFWRHLPAIPGAGLPAGAVRLATEIGAPAALARLLSHIVLLDDGDDGDAVQATLAPGVIAVTRAGACWRWDGLVTRAGAPNPAAARLAQLARLQAARTELARARQDESEAGAACGDALRGEGEAVAADTDARAACAAAQAALREAADRTEGVQAEASRSAARLAVLRPVVDRLAGEHETAVRDAARALLALQSLPHQVALDGTKGVTAAASQAAAAALATARDRRGPARQRAVAAQARTRDMEAVAASIEAKIAAASSALARAGADREAAIRDAADSAAAGARMPDIAVLQEECKQAAHDESTSRVMAAEVRLACQAQEAALDQARQEEAASRLAHAQAELRFEAVRELIDRIETEMIEAVCQEADGEALQAGRVDPAVLAAAAHSARQACDAAREAMLACERRLDGVLDEIARADSLRTGLLDDGSAWQRRLGEATARHAGLLTRCVAARLAWSSLSARPREVAERLARSGETLRAAEAGHRQAAARLADAEQRLRGLAAAERDAALAASEGRERHMRAHAACEAAEGLVRSVLARAAERLGGAALPDVSDLSDAAEERARRRFERLGRERDEMGPVNLLAETEMAALDARIGGLESERDELVTAIARLRGAIGHLNREGRDRLGAIFTDVDRHFRTLFTRMMGGGRAHLAMTGSTDPLEAGLEIYAEPPGKKLSALSLLSGGEQALTALSLIFAVFRCTPAPVCVLDEVDAPLDDANVERFCILLDQMVRDTGTSFLVVTHHQLTMSRMDRLYGVTMQERGVSRLLSVDLGRAAVMLQAAE